MTQNSYDLYIFHHAKAAARIGLTAGCEIDDHGRSIPLKNLKGELTRLGRHQNAMRLLSERETVSLSDMARHKLFAYWINPVLDSAWPADHFVYDDVRRLTPRNLRQMTHRIPDSRAVSSVQIVLDVFTATNGFKTVPGPRPMERLQKALAAMPAVQRDIFTARCLDTPRSPCQRLAERHDMARPKVRAVEAQLRRKLTTRLGGPDYLESGIEGLRRQRALGTPRP